MSSSRSKKIFLILSVAVPFIAYCLYYYTMMVGNAPYKFSEFKSIVFEYGTGDSLLNKYNSATGDYQYVDARDSLIKKHLRLNKDELLYLHRKAADLGFWNFPAVEKNHSNPDKNAPHYNIQYNYDRKSKTVLYSADFDGPETLKDANQRLIKEIQRILNDAEIKHKK